MSCDSLKYAEEIVFVEERDAETLKKAGIPVGFVLPGIDAVTSAPVGFQLANGDTIHIEKQHVSAGIQQELTSDDLPVSVFTGFVTASGIQQLNGVRFSHSTGKQPMFSHDSLRRAEMLLED